MPPTCLLPVSLPKAGDGNEAHYREDGIVFSEGDGHSNLRPRRGVYGVSLCKSVWHFLGHTVGTMSIQLLIGR